MPGASPSHSAEPIHPVPGADLATARQVAERIRLSVADLREPHHTGPLGFVTVSVGVAVAQPDQPGSPDHLIADADQAL